MLAQVQEASGDSKGLEYAQIYAQWGETSKALEWLEKAKQLGDPELRNLRVDPLLDPLRNEPRFQAIKQAVERALKFPY
jgi:predicted Zn-dependent protease